MSERGRDGNRRARKGITVSNVTRSVPFDVSVGADLHRKIRESLNLYQFACRKAFSVCALAEHAGAEIACTEKGLTVKPSSRAAKTILAEAFGIQDKKAHLYELRLWLRDLCPTWMSIVPEAIHRDVSDRWKSKDPEITKAGRGFLVLQGERGMARFQHIGMPFKNTVPKLSGHSIRAKWDFDIGEVEFRIGKLDGSRYYIWKNLRDGAPGWKLGGMRLVERKNRLRVVVTYHCPSKDETLDAGKAVKVEFTGDPESFITMRGPGNLQGDVISFASADEILRRLDARRIGLEAARKAAGNPRRAWGNRRAWKSIVGKSERNSSRRTKVVEDYNHCWTRRIVSNMRRWRAGVVYVVNLPERDVFDHPWQWAHFRFCLDYKVKEIGGEPKCLTKEKQEAA